ncbi:hypothetical protein ACFL1H_07315 [Nanoarchaeota archaeon]
MNKTMTVKRKKHQDVIPGESVHVKIPSNKRFLKLLIPLTLGGCAFIPFNDTNGYEIVKDKVIDLHTFIQTKIQKDKYNKFVQENGFTIVKDDCVFVKNKQNYVINIGTVQKNGLEKKTRSKGSRVKFTNSTESTGFPNSRLEKITASACMYANQNEDFKKAIISGFQFYDVAQSRDEDINELEAKMSELKLRRTNKDISRKKYEKQNLPLFNEHMRKTSTRMSYLKNADQELTFALGILNTKMFELSEEYTKNNKPQGKYGYTGRELEGYVKETYPEEYDNINQARILIQTKIMDIDNYSIEKYGYSASPYIINHDKWDKMAEDTKPNKTIEKKVVEKPIIEKKEPTYTIIQPEITKKTEQEIVEEKPSNIQIKKTYVSLNSDFYFTSFECKTKYKKAEEACERKYMLKDIDCQNSFDYCKDQ